MNRERRYITLHPRYQLRGWRDRPYALYDWEAWGGEYKKILPLTKAQFSGIELATMPGVSIDDALFPAPLKQAAEKLISAGIFIERDRDAGLSDFQKYRFADTRMTHELVWSITGKCNLRCRHCYIHGGEGAYGEFTFRECEDIVRQMTEAGIYMVAITGGEKGDYKCEGKNSGVRYKGKDRTFMEKVEDLNDKVVKEVVDFTRKYL